MPSGNAGSQVAPGRKANERDGGGAPVTSRGFRIARIMQFLCAAGIITAVVFTLVLLKRSGDISDRLEVTVGLNEEVRGIVQLANSAKSAQQTYAGSQDTVDIEALRATLSEARSAIAELGKGSSEDPTLERIAELKEQVEQYIRLLADAPSGPGAIAALREKLWEQTIVTADAIKRGQDIETLAAAVSMRELRQRVLAAILGILFAAMGFGVMSAIIDANFVRDIQKARRKLQSANIELEAKVIERTQELESANTDLQSQNERIEGLLADMNHRVGNSLQFVASFLHMQERISDQDDVKQALATAGERVAAIASAQRRLRLSDDYEWCRADSLLAEFISDLKPVYEADKSVKLHFEAEPVILRGRDAISLCVAVGELMSNAYKHAFPRGIAGEIRLSVFLEDEGETVAVEVVDNGVGRENDDTKADGGLGLRVVETMVESISASLARSSAAKGSKRPGTRFTIRFPAQIASDGSPSSDENVSEEQRASA